MSSYATLQGCRTLLKADVTTDDTVIAGLIEAASNRIDTYTGSFFGEQYRAFPFTVELGRRQMRFYPFGRPLLSVITLTNGDGTTIPANGYTLYPADGYPKTELNLTVDYVWFPAAGAMVYEDVDGIRPKGITFEGSRNTVTYMGYGRAAYIRDAVTVTGRWGYHSDYDYAWQSTGKTLSGAINATTTSITLSAAASTALDVGDVLRLVTGGATEYVRVVGPIANFAAATVITVRRGYNGSTAIAHDTAIAISRWLPEPIIVTATEMLVAAMYASRNNPAGDRLVVEGIGAISIPGRMPDRIKDLIEGYVNVMTGRR